MIIRSITKGDYKKLLDLDKEVYPTDSPVTEKILDKWYALNPEFGMIYEENNKIIGVCIVIPLNKKGLEKLINGELAESDLDDKWIFNNKKDKAIGIHGYHLEKLKPEIKSFYKTCLQDLSLIINNLKNHNPKIKVIGFSGLCVTKDGINLLENEFNCRERKFISRENIIEKEGRKKIILTEEKDKNIKLPKGYILLNKCKMLVTYPGEKEYCLGLFVIYINV